MLGIFLSFKNDEKEVKPARVLLDFKVNFLVTVLAADGGELLSADGTGNAVVAFVRFKVAGKIALSKLFVADLAFSVLK